MEFNEYTPKGGWLKYRRNQKIKETLKAWGAALFLLAVYVIAGNIERGF